MSIGFVSNDPLNNLTNLYDRPIYISANRAPTANDFQDPGTFWQNANAGSPLVYQTTGKGVWNLANASSSSLNTLTGDSGGALSPSGNNISLLGTTNQITTTGSGSTITWTLSSTLLAPGTLEVTGLLTGDAGITVSGGAVAINSGTNAFGLSTDASATTVSIATGSAVKGVTVGSTNSTSATTIQAGTGNLVLSGATTTTYTIGTSTGTGAISVGISTAAETINISNAASNTGASAVNILSGATPGANQTLTIMSGVSTAGSQAISALGAAISQGTNSASFFGGIASGGTNTFNVFAGAFTGGTNSINLFSGAFTTVAAAFNLFTGASTSIGTTSIGTGTSAAHVTNIGSNAGGNVTIIGGSAATIGIGLGGNAGQIITIGAAAQTGAISIGTSTGALTAALLNGVAASSQTLNIASGTSATGAQTVNLLSGTTPGASQTLNIMCGAASAGTQAVNIAATGATRATTISIGTGAAAHICTLGSTNGAAATTVQAGTGGISLSAAGAVSMAPATGSAASANITLNGRVFQSTHTGLTTASAASQAFVITNSAVTATTQAVQISVDNLGSNDAQMTIQRVLLAVGTITVTLKNNGAAALNGDVHINGWVLN